MQSQQKTETNKDYSRNQWNSTKIPFLGKINTIDNPLTTMNNIKKEKIQITNIRN